MVPKDFFRLGLIVLIGLVFIFSACEKKTIVNPPPQETASCFLCHSDSSTKILAAEKQWEHSVHSTGAHISENISNCSFCHTNEGFVTKLTTGTVPAAIENPTAIGCFTCHAPHTAGNLSLRTSAPYMLLDSTASSTYNKGQSNICAHCHHGRRNVNTYVKDEVKMTQTFGPHHSNQSDMLLGTNAYEYAGVTYTDSYHSTGVTDGCLTCHMKTVVGYTLGGHSTNMVWEEEENVETCNISGCHRGAPLTSFNRKASEDFDGDGTIEGVQDEIEGLLEQLKNKLIAANLLTTEGDPVERIVATKDSVGAVFDYKFVEGDGSEGIHNAKYAVKLLQSSMDFLSPPMTSK
jgi:hypothetical protein